MTAKEAFIEEVREEGLVGEEGLLNDVPKESVQARGFFTIDASGCYLDFCRGEGEIIWSGRGSLHRFLMLAWSCVSTRSSVGK
ncbi:hypothetical protein AVEN_124523-1 [Araneus ventricosus]|uniref:Uncharacterized protein n=1 Tax=Araneus ventricosus TaxID=182803 RepID=A0A4Y2WXA8_ARAVE|nr:hypothetical protein AVEN_124523-1 [Araneus ventricosus]